MREAMFFNNEGVVLPINSIVGAWQFEDNANDSIGTNHGVESNMQYADGIVGRCADFSLGSTSSKITIPDNDLFTFSDVGGDIDYSISFLIRKTNTTDEEIIYKFTTSPNFEWRFRYSIVNTRYIYQMHDAIEGGAPFIINNIGSTVNTWQHVVITYIDGIIRWYWNGINTNFQIDVGTYVQQRNTLAPIVLGQKFTGFLGELFIWRGVGLTQEEVTELYTQQSNGINILG